MVPPNVKIDIKLLFSLSKLILRRVLDTEPDATISLTSAILHVRKQLLTGSIALAIEKLRSSFNNIKLLFSQTITNQRYIATGTRTYTDLSFINCKISSKLTLALKKS